MVEGVGTDGQFSGRPVVCARVLVETGLGTFEAYTDSSGSFGSGLSGPSGYAIHVLPPEGSGLAALSVYDLHTSQTGLRLRVALPVNRPVGPTQPGPGLRRAVTGVLLDPSGTPQPGFLPPGARPGDPGTIGFVWWGAYGRPSDSTWVDSAVADDGGRFEVWTASGGARPLTRPLFAGNYTGRSASRDVWFFREYALVPSVASGQDGGTAVGEVRMRQVDRSLLVQYDQDARDVLRSLGRDGLSFVYVVADAGPGLDSLEVAQAHTGPAVGTLALYQVVPVPALLDTGSPFRGISGLGYAYDASVTDGTGELSVTRSPLVGGVIGVSYLAAPGRPWWDGARSSFSWQAVPQATAYEVNLRDRQGRLVWAGVRGRGGGEARLPFRLVGPGSFVYVYATDSRGPETWVLDGGSGGPATLRKAGRTSAGSRARVALEDVSRPVRESFSRTVFLGP